MPGKMDTFAAKQNEPAPTLFSSMVQSTVECWQTATREIFTAMHAGNGQKRGQGYRAEPIKPYSPESFQQMFDLMYATMLQNSPAGARTEDQHRTPPVALKLLQDGFKWGNKAFHVDRLVDVQGNVSGDMLNLNFLLMNPARLMIDKYHGYMENMDDKQFVENFVRMEKWIFDSPDVPGEVFREFIKDCYQENKLINNKLEVDGQLVDLSKISMPVLNIYALYDHLVPPAACENFIRKIGSKNAQNYTLETGHIVIYVSSRSQKTFVPKICSRLWARDAEPVKKKKTRSAKSQQLKKRSAQAAQETPGKTSTVIPKAARG